MTSFNSKSRWFRNPEHANVFISFCALIVGLLSIALSIVTLFESQKQFQLEREAIKQDSIDQRIRFAQDSIHKEIQFKEVSNMLHRYDSISTSQLITVQQQLDISKKMQEDQIASERPMLSIVTVEVDDHTFQPDSFEYSPTFHVVLKNIGKRPAVNFRATASVQHKSNLTEFAKKKLLLINPINPEEEKFVEYSPKLTTHNRLRIIYKLDINYLDPLTNKSFSNSLYYHTVETNNVLRLQELSRDLLNFITQKIKVNGYYNPDTDHFIEIHN